MAAGAGVVAAAVTEQVVLVMVSSVLVADEVMVVSILMRVGMSRPRHPTAAT